MTKVYNIVCKFPILTSVFIAIIIVASVIQFLSGGINLIEAFQYFLGLLFMALGLKILIIFMLSRESIKLIDAKEVPALMSLTLISFFFLLSCVLLFPILLKL